jgi:uncharacterized protein YndB with AHSA1/START domain
MRGRGWRVGTVGCRAVQQVLVERDFTQPVGRLFAYLSEHENLGTIFPMRVERVRDGENGERNGVGSVRRLSMGGLMPFEETVTAVEPDRLIEYRITKGSPMTGHRGQMEFSEREGGGSHLRYEIVFGAKVPGLDRVVAAGLRRSIARGLGTVATEA